MSEPSSRQDGHGQLRRSTPQAYNLAVAMQALGGATAQALEAACTRSCRNLNMSVLFQLASPSPTASHPLRLYVACYSVRHCGAICGSQQQGGVIQYGHQECIAAA